ncbi:class I SAM-dependent methyltransferase [Sphingomonas sp. CFBP 13728]|uniref:class I SAM-dependent methyltransferase n=1 Tax=Sphingomonas sp. CFBP 13728 TaxID=2775294 RepID=UPI00177EFDE3|nr:class I SAM-dependent methyltransferase [Sphingomonas sp. CFBP 13728]MBD8620611.1 class I SAM-dependent methyltransferase [Sphingomonas sp. CFBP 13728]
MFDAMNTRDDEHWNYFTQDRQYSDLLKQRLNDGVKMDSASTMGRYLNENATGDLAIVDFGGGPGHYYPVIADRYEHGSVDYHSVDIDADNIAFGTCHFGHNAHARFSVGSALDPAEFLVDRNCVISANTLPHIPTIEPLLTAITAAPSVRFFLFRMLIGEECVQIKKHLSDTSFEDLFERGYQHNNIYSLPYLQSLLGETWSLDRLPDLYDIDRLAGHSVPMQATDHFYSNRVSRPVGDMIFKGDIYMPWTFVLGTRTTE